MQQERKEVGEPVSKIVSQAARYITTIKSIHRLLLTRFNPEVLGSYVGDVFRPPSVKELRVRFAVNPAIVERPVAEAQNLRCDEAFLDERLPGLGRVKPARGVHGSRQSTVDIVDRKSTRL